MSDDILSKVADVVRLYYRPVTASEIAQASGISSPAANNVLNRLVQQGIVEVVKDGSGNYFQIPITEKSKEEANLDVKFARLDEGLTEKAENLNRRIEQVEKETEHIYANMISIMGVFVAIFALIVINANAIVGTFSGEGSLTLTLMNLLVLNVPVAICIIALLFGIRLIILRDFKRGDHE